MLADEIGNDAGSSFQAQPESSTYRIAASAIYTASTNTYEDRIWFSGSTEEAFDFVCDIHVGPGTP